MFKYFAIIICSALFLYMMIDVWDKYDNKMTSMGIRFKGENIKEKQLPCITACPWNAFRKRGLYFKREVFMRQTFEREEIFYNASGVNLYDESLYYVEEIHSIFLGRCYMACQLKSLPRKMSLFFYLYKYRDYKSNQDIFLTGRGSECQKSEH
jgi:hypothetical protein